MEKIPMTIIEKAREMGKVIQESEEYKVLMAAREASDNDDGLQQQIQQFNLVRMNLEMESSKSDADQEKVSSLNEELMSIYTQVMDNENMVAFNAAKDVIDHIMNNATSILAAAVNGEDPMTFDPEAHSCSGSCSSCGGCH
jgi:cell fate (sporulation/competence/biofilm development) regulator YlbF (YheA/YmcA/DUF963 family)